MKLLHLNPDDVDILCKTLCSPGGECKDGRKDPDINAHHLAQCALTLASFVLYHNEHCDLRCILKMITHECADDLNLSIAREIKHNKDL